MSMRILTILLLATTLALAGCEKEPEPENELVGTSWTITREENYATFSFYKDDVVKYYNKGSEEEVSWEGTYKFHKPEVTMWQSNGREIQGYLNGDELTIKFPGQPSVVFHRD